MSTLWNIVGGGVLDILGLATEEMTKGGQTPYKSYTPNSDLESVQSMLIKQRKLKAFEEAKKQESQKKITQIAIVAGVGVIAFMSLKS